VRTMMKLPLIVISVLFSVCAAASVAGHYVQTPTAEVWSTCIHRVEHGSKIVETDDQMRIISPSGAVRTVERCPMPNRRLPTRRTAPGASPADGWQVWTTFQHPQNETFTTFVGNFTVPPAPTSFGGGILYMFFGLQSDNWVPIANEPPAPPTFDIIQPVLQYGLGPAGGGNFWGLASWYVTLNAGAAHSDLIKINPGDIVVGNMTMTGATEWFISGVVNGKASSISATHPRLASQPWAYTTLELYQISSCSFMPPSGSSIKFSGMHLTDKSGAIEPQWRVNSNGAGNHCSTSVTVTDASDTSINF